MMNCEKDLHNEEERISNQILAREKNKTKTINRKKKSNKKIADKLQVSYLDMLRGSWIVSE